MKTAYYFLGIGGIGMSALARYFLHEGCRVAGYDRTPTRLTAELEQEGAEIHYDESVEAIPVEMRDPQTTLVVYTPAVPTDHAEYRYFVEQGFTIEKRSQMLGYLSEGTRQDDHFDPGGVAQPCHDGGRIGLPGWYLEEFCRQPRLGRGRSFGGGGRRI